MTVENLDDRGVSGINEFDDAFDKAAETGEKAELSPADDPKNVPAGEEKPVETPAEPPPEEPAKPAETPPADQQPGESDEKYEQRYKTLQGIHRKDKELWEAEKAQLLTQVEELKKPVEKPPEKPETTDLGNLYDSLSEEDKAALKDYDEEFDTVSKMEGKKRDAAFKALEKKFDAFKAELVAQIAPATALVQETKVVQEKKVEEDHFSSIRKGHPDFEKYRDDGSILKWIEEKPKYLQKSMLETYSKGAAEDVVELIGDFKRENNIEPPEESSNVVQIDAKKAERKQAFTAVKTRRGAVNAGMSVATDFDGAFDEALNKQGG